MQNKIKQYAYIIYLEDDVLLSKKTYKDWREIQTEYYETFKASLPPMTSEEIISFFADDFCDEQNWPFSRETILNFFSDCLSMVISSTKIKMKT